MSKHKSPYFADTNITTEFRRTGVYSRRRKTITKRREQAPPYKNICKKGDLYIMKATGIV